MNLQHIERLASVQEDIVRKTEDDIRQLEKYGNEYRALKEQLSTLPDRISYDIMVPFGTVAFMPGKLVHTNEIRVLLGDDWFVDRSAKQAVEIIERRLQTVDEDIASLKKQKDLLKPHLDFTKEFREQAQQEAKIVEEYNEDEEKAWRAQHRLNVKKYYEEQKAARDAERQKDEEAYWKKMEEEEAAGRENEEFDDTLSSSMLMCTESDKSEADQLSITNAESLSDRIQTQPTVCRDPSRRKSTETVTKKNAGKRVRWQDIVRNESKEEEGETSSDDSEEYVELCRPTTINFVHTPSTNAVQPVQRSSPTESSTVESGVRQILSPADIGLCPVFAAPKSILKKRMSTEDKSQRPPAAVTQDTGSRVVQKSSSPSRTPCDVVTTPFRQPLHPSATLPLVKVVERDTSLSETPKQTSDSTVSCADATSNNDDSKRISKFKASRLKKTPNAK